MISVITPTGDRPEALNMLVGYVARQTFRGPVKWIIVDDGKEPFCPDLSRLPANVTVQYIRRDEPGVKGGSLNRNVIVALRHVQFDNVVFMEDDDWYAPHYLATMLDMLSVHDIAGEGLAKYYNVRERKMLGMSNRKHASLAQTGFRREHWQFIDSCCRIGGPFIDMEIWKRPKTHGGHELRKSVFFSHGLCVGIKGMPGRGGLGTGHRVKGNKWTSDTDLKLLRKMIHGDADRYAEFYVPEPKNIFDLLASPWAQKPWAIIGKGPTFSQRDPEKLKSMRTIGLNHVIREQPVDIVHFIDLHGATDLQDLLLRAKYVVVPWHPHVHCKAHEKTLQQHAAEIPILRKLNSEGRLLTYHASTGRKFKDRPAGQQEVPVKFFSAEAAVNLLLMSGIKHVDLIGIDGGSSYAADFADMAPLINGRKDFNDQFAELDAAAKRHEATLTFAGRSYVNH